MYQFARACTSYARLYGNYIDTVQIMQWWAPLHTIELFPRRDDIKGQIVTTI